MKLSGILLFIATMHIMATGYSQTASLNLKVDKVPMREVFKEIERQSDLSFIFNDDMSSLNEEVSINVRNVNVRDVLNSVFKNSDLSYEILSDKLIVVAPKAVLQQMEVTGVITDDNGEPLVGANVIIKGTTIGVVTNVNGRFSIAVPNKDAVLVFSYVGYITQEIAVGEQKNINIQLVENALDLEEVVVIGYGTVKKSDLTGAVASVSNKSFKDQPVVRVEDALQGRMSGVEVTNMSGVPGGDVKIRVRGTNSINKSNDPLYIVDGIVRPSGLNGINTADIQSIEVLKDASSTAIYGSRGANGVVLITTKRGKEGRAQIVLETEFGLSYMAKKYDLLNAYDYALMLNEVGASNTISAQDVEAYKNGTKGIDWQDVMTQTGFIQNYRLSISGGNKDTKYFISGNILDQSAITVTTKYQRYQFRANLDTKVTPWLNIVTDLNAARTSNHNRNVDLWSALNYSPTMEMKNETTGIYNKDPYNNNIANNPYGMLMERDRDNYNNIVNGNLDLRFNIIDGLTLSVQGGLNYIDNPSYFFSSSTIAPSTQSQMENYTSRTFMWQNTNNLTYTKKIGDHSLTAMAVFELSKNQWSGMGVYGTNLQTESVGYWNVLNATSRREDNSYSAEQMASAVGRFMYSYKGRYMLTGTFRADGSSKFQDDNKWGYFPSGAVAWNITEEDFMSGQNIFQQLKLRTSIGVVGNQGIGRYETLGTLASTSYAYGTGTLYTGYWGNSFATPYLSWEKTLQYDLGVDFSVWDQRLNFTVDWFLKQTKDLLFQKDIPGYNGGGKIWVNQGEIKNTGVEFSINAYPIRNKFTWESTLNATYLKNEITDLAGDPFILGPSPHTGLMGYPTRMEVGKPIGMFYLYKWEGIDQNGANLYYVNPENYINSDKTPNKNSPMTDDKFVTGNANPKWTFGWNNMFAWKNWEANIFINAAFGFNRLNITRFSTASMVGDTKVVTLKDAYFKSWDKVSNKADAEFPSLKNTNNKYFGDSSQWLEDAGFVKLRNVSIAYRIPRSLLKFADIRLSLSCQNLLTLTKYKGLDPEVIYVGSNVDQTNGVDYGAYPIPRTFTFGVRLDF